MLDVLTAATICEAITGRRVVLEQHADLVWAESQRNTTNKSDLDDVFQRHLIFRGALKNGAVDVINAEPDAVQGSH